jgi:ElaB/YqjD/DUF883 family membrane-anchored ribosome-binding protein
MAEQTFQETSSTQAGSGSKGNTDTLRNVRDQAAAAGRDLKEKAAHFVETSDEKIREQAAGLADAARDAASQATDRIKETVDEKKGAGAEYIGNLAEAMRRASREFDAELPIAGKYIRQAANQVEGFSDSIRSGDFNDLIRSAQSFARRQPTAFLGLAALAGFAAVRFLKSSSGSTRNSRPEGTRSSYPEGGNQEQRSSYRTAADIAGDRGQRATADYRG